MMIGYLKPWKFFRVTMSKRMDYDNPVYLGVSFTEKYAKLAITDDTLSIASKYGSRSGFIIDNTLLDKLVDIVESLKNDRVEKYELLGIIVATNSSAAPLIHDLMGNLRKKGNLEGLKYTCWKDDFVSDNLACECKAWRNSFPLVKKHRLYEPLVEFSAEHMLQRFLDFFRALYMNKYKELNDEDKEREVEDKEVEDSERTVRSSMIKYLEPMQFFRETMDKDNRTLLLGLSVTDESVRVVLCYDRLNEHSPDDLFEFRRDETFLDALVYFIQHCQTNIVEGCELVGIIVDNNNFDKNIHNLLGDLCKKLNYESLKYTCWKDDFTLENPSFECNQFGSLFWGITFPIVDSYTVQLGYFSTHHMIRNFLGFFSTLFRDEDKEWEEKDLETEDSNRKKLCEICFHFYGCGP